MRSLERELGKVLRKTATQIASKQAKAPLKIDIDAVRDALGHQKFFQESAARTAVPGVATGLAVTGSGGDVLFIEATTMKGASSGGGLELTGQLGDVMKESAKIALSYVHAHAPQLGIPEEAFENHNVHIHVPAGAIPKDGPSAGVAGDAPHGAVPLLTARPVKQHRWHDRRDHAAGAGLPIGGLKQKALAAHAAGLTDVTSPSATAATSTTCPPRCASRCASTR